MVHCSVNSFNHTHLHIGIYIYIYTYINIQKTILDFTDTSTLCVLFYYSNTFYLSKQCSSGLTFFPLILNFPKNEKKETYVIDFFFAFFCPNKRRSFYLVIVRMAFVVGLRLRLRLVQDHMD